MDAPLLSLPTQLHDDRDGFCGLAFGDDAQPGDTYGVWIDFKTVQPCAPSTLTLECTERHNVGTWSYRYLDEHGFVLHVTPAAPGPGSWQGAYRLWPVPIDESESA